MNINMNDIPTTIGHFPVELIDDIVIHLHPNDINRLSRTSKRFFNHLSTPPTYSFAKRNIISILPSHSNNDTTQVSAIKDLFNTIHPNKIYWAVFITMIGVKTAASSMLGIQVRSMEWFVPDEVPNGELFCNALSLAITSEGAKMHVMDDDGLALLFLVAAGDLTTLVHLHNENMLTKANGSFERILIEAVSRGQKDIVDWVRSLGGCHSLGIDRCAVLDAAIEAGDLEMIKLFYDPEEDSANEGIIYSHDSGYTWDTKILDYFLKVSHVDPVNLLQRLHVNFWWPDDLAGFEHLCQDRRISRDSLPPYLPSQLLHAAVKLGSFSMVQRFTEWGGLDPQTNGLLLLQVATKVEPPAFDIVEFLLQMHLIQPFTDTTDVPAFTECLKFAAMNGSVNIIKLLFGMEGFVLGKHRPVLEWAVEAGQHKVVQYLLEVKDFSPREIYLAISLAFDNNRPRVVQVLLNFVQATNWESKIFETLDRWARFDNLHECFLYACNMRLGGIVRVFVESGIVDPSFSDAEAFKSICGFFDCDDSDECDEGQSDRTESENGSVFDGDRDEGSEDDDDDDGCMMELDGNPEMGVEMDVDVFDSDGIRKWDFNEDDTSQEYNHRTICQYLIDSGKVLRPGLTKAVLVAATSLPVSMFRQVMEQCCFSLDVLDSDVISEAFTNAIEGFQLETLRLILTTRTSYQPKELLPALDAAIACDSEVCGYEILKHLTVGSVEYGNAVKALDNNCSVGLILHIWRLLESESRWKFFDLAAEKERWDIVRGMVANVEGTRGFISLEMVKARGTIISEDLINTNKLDTILNNPSLQSSTLIHDIWFLGDDYQAACIAILGIERSVKLFVGDLYTCEQSPYKLRNLEMPMHGEWLDNNMSDTKQFCKILSMAALAGDVDLEACDFTAMFFLAGIGDLDTLVKLEQMKMLPANAHHRILCEAIFHKKDDVALWVLSLKVVDPSLENNKALFAAIENGRKAVIQQLVDDARVVSTVDWNAAMVTVIHSTWGNDIDLLNLVYRTDLVNPVDVIMNAQPWDTTSHSTFELLSQNLDNNATNFTLSQRDSIFPNAIRVGSIKSVIKFVESGWLQHFRMPYLYLRTAAMNQQWEILEYLLSLGEFHIPNATYFKSYREELGAVVKVAAEYGKLGIIRTVMDMVAVYNNNDVDIFLFFFDSVMNDVLDIAARFGQLEVIDYVMKCEDIDIKELTYKCLITSVSENRPESLHAILTSKRQVDVNRPFKLSKGSWVSDETYPWEDTPFFDCLLYDACWFRSFGIVKVLVESGPCSLTAYDGLAFRIAAGIMEEEWVTSSGYICGLSESEASFTESEGESCSEDFEDDGNDEGDSWVTEDDFDKDACQDIAAEDGSGGNGVPARISLALYRYEYNDRISICKYLLDHGAVVPGMSTKVLEASVSLPIDIFQSVVNHGGFTQDHIAHVASISASFKFSTLANQLATLEFLLMTSEKFSCNVLRSGLTAAVTCGLQSFFRAMVNKLSEEKDVNEDNMVEWSRIMIGAVKHGWCNDLVMAIWSKVCKNAKIEVLEYLHDNGLNDVVKALRDVDENGVIDSWMVSLLSNS
ncbi:hypothetical protein HDU76_000713 [Blyttiomyces sp. JEL0837]|nr:hypothetical protein HDU76_000713 [Blyttiomyces sp. JEL0837]